MIRTYQELMTFSDFKSRYRYLRLDGQVAADTFGFDRYVNQRFYRSEEWKRVRNYVIVRDTIGDNCCDLGVPGYEIYGRIYIHHMNPISLRDIRDASEYLLNPDYLICTTHLTHNAIHYGDESLLITEPVERSRDDTCPWKLL